MTKKRRLQIRNSTAEFLIFTNQAKEDGIEVRVQNEMIWLSQKLMATLFDCSTDNISLHLKNIFKENELDEDSVTEEFSVTASDRKTYKTKHYNLDAIIAVGYRVNSKRATTFRQWATSVLRDYAIRGYVIDKKRMENGTFLNEDYFEHLLAEIRLFCYRNSNLNFIFINTSLFKNSQESSFFHVLTTVYGYNHGFIGSWVVIKLVRTFGSFVNKTVLFQCFDKVLWA